MNLSFSKSAKLRLGGSVAGCLVALIAGQPASAQCVVDSSGVCVLNNTGTTGSIVATGATSITNTGTIGAISQSRPALLVIDNKAGGTIASAALVGGLDTIAGAQALNGTVQRTGSVLINAGTISGDVKLAAGTIYVNAGGTVGGSLTTTTSAPTGSTFFVNRTANLGVSGSLNLTNALDYFIQSFSASGSYDLASSLPASFEKAGVEALGGATAITLSGSTNGFSIFGNGSIVNNGTIGASFTFFAPNGAPLFQAPAVTYSGVIGQAKTLFAFNPFNGGVQTIQFGSSLAAFTNAGTINGDIRVSAERFENSGDINLRSADPGTLILAAADKDFTFINSGDVTFANTGGRGIRGPLTPDAAITVVSAPDTTTPKNVSLANSGNISGGFFFAGFASDFTFDNTGAVSIGNNPNNVDRAVELSVGAFDFALNTDLEDYGFANSVAITNSGTLTGGMSAEATSRVFSFTNSNIIASDPNDNFANALDLSVYGHEVQGNDDLEIDAETVTITNTGTITGTVDTDFEATNVTFNNSGTITRSVIPGATLFANGASGLEIEQQTTLGATLNFTNSGTIRTADYAGGAVTIDVEAGDIESGDPLAASANATVTVVNSGTIHGSGGSYLTPGQLVGLPANNLLTDLSTGLVINADAEGASTVSITNEEGGVISARGPARLGLPNGAQIIANQLPTTSGVAVAVVARDTAADTVSIVNAGTILGSPISGSLTLDNGSIIVPNTESEIDFEGILGTGIDTFNSTDLITNTETGIIVGGLALRDGNDILNNYGSISGNLFFGDGDDQFVQGINAIFNGMANGGSGADTFLIDITGGGTINQALYNQLVSFETIGLTGSGALQSNVQVSVQGGSLELEEGSTISQPGGTAISGSESEGDAVSNAGTIIGNVNLGGGDNSLTNDGTIEGNVNTGNGNDQVANNGFVTGDVDLGDGDDQFSNTGTISGDVNLAGGSDTVDGSAIGTVGGTISGGDDEGTDSVEFTLAPQTTQSVARSFALLAETVLPDTVLDLGLFEKLDGFEQVFVNGPGTIEASGALPVGVIILTGANLHVAAEASLGTTGPNTITGSDGAEQVEVDGTITGGIALGGGTDRLVTSGRVVGPVDLGAGADRLIFTGPATFGSTVAGGEGIDTVEIATSTTYAAPTELSFAGFSGFEGLTQTSGTNAISGTANVGPVTVSGGRLIGRIGSTITGNVQIASGATFGSAGAVNGNIAVAGGGTLSPGASPGTMTITGNVALAAGSTTVFEMTPTISDAIVITGSLAITTGARLTLTGERPLTPGVAYNLITASGGITGSFATADITKAASVLGFINQTANAIQLLGTFQLRTGANPQVAATNSYLNSLLIGGTATTGLLAAVPGLVGSDGFANQAVLARLHPEPYASALQLGFETGLAASKAARSIGTNLSAEGGVYTFAEGFGNWRRLQADPITGTSKANAHAYGVLGGLGYGNENFGLGVFVGRVEGRQNIAALGSSTRADGMIAGVAANASLGGLRIAASWTTDRSTADTSRSLPTLGTAESRYRLRGWTADAAVSYAFEIGSGWKLSPEVSVTHLSYRRGTVSETGAGAFNLNVAGDRQKATFVSGSLNLEGEASATVVPWLSAGVRQQTSGRGTSATASLSGATAAFTVLGAERSKTVATVDAGVTWKLSNGVALYATGGTEFGAENTGQSGTLGIRIGF